MTDAEITKRNRGNKRRGSAWESALLTGLREHFEVERLAKAGKDDEGDLVVFDGGPADPTKKVLVEAKSGAMKSADFIRQAKVEKANYLAKRPHLNPADVEFAVFVKAPGKGWQDGYVLTTISEFFGLDNIKEEE